MRFLVLSLTACLTLCGCVLFPEPYNATHYFDLGVPDTISPKGIELNIESLTSGKSYRTKMVYRTSPCAVEIDEYNKWMSPPDILIANYLNRAFAVNGREDDFRRYTLGGELLCFDIDLASKTARLGVRYSISEARGGEDAVSEGGVLTASKLYRQSFDVESPAAFASAMSQAAAKLAADIRADLDSITTRED